MAKVYPYKQTHALLLSWVDSRTDMITAKDEFAATLHENYAPTSITKLRLGSENLTSTEASLSSVEAWIKLHSHPDSLILIFYVGHGGPSEDGLLDLHPHYACVEPPDEVALPWGFLYDLIYHYSRSDVLVILNCCNAGAAMNEPPQNLGPENSRAIELLMACGADQFTVYQETFHRALIATLKKMSIKCKAFSAGYLGREIALQVHRWRTQRSIAEQRTNTSGLSQPFHARLNDGPERRQILLKSSKTGAPAGPNAKNISDPPPGWDTDCNNRIFAGWEIVAAGGAKGAGGAKIPWWLRRFHYRQNA